MKMIFKSAAVAAVGLSLGLTMGLTSAHAGDGGYSKAIKKAIYKNEHRKEGDSARDQYRHPGKVLKFFGITEKSAVGEVNPGGMWYSRILGPLLKDKGLYAGLEHHPAHYSNYANYAKNLKAYSSKVAGMKDVFGDRAIGANLFQINSPVKEGSLDVVMVVRAMHNWHRRDFMVGGLAEVHSKLKDGGILGVVQHREPETSKATTDESTQRGRWKQSELIKIIEKNGFKLVEASEINANKKDDGTRSVWTLLPGLRGPAEGKEERRKIGESDRMTLKFKKVSKK